MRTWRNADKRALGIGLAHSALWFVLLSIDQRGVTANVLWRSAAVGLVTGLALAAIEAFRARRR